MMAASLTANAKDKQDADFEYVFNPHWYIQAQVGGQHTLGEIGFGDLLSPNAQLALGYNFNPVVGTRLAVNAWQSKAGSKIYGNEYKWKWNYVAPTLDFTFNLSNLFCGYNPERKLNMGVFAGVGANIGFGNDEAVDVAPVVNRAVNADDDQALRHLWDGTKVRLMGKVGANVDYRISDAWSIGLEVSANTLNDHYNSKKAGNSDWYFNALVGVKYNFGKTFTKKAKEKKECCKPQVVEKIVERIVEKPAPAPAPAVVEKIEPIRRDVFFLIRSGEISSTEMQKVSEIADYLKKYPKAKVTVTGYADKGTGNAKINMGLSEKRAKAVVDALVNKFGVDRSRIISAAKGDTEQPYAEEVLNRVSICIAE